MPDEIPLDFPGQITRGRMVYTGSCMLCLPVFLIPCGTDHHLTVAALAFMVWEILITFDDEVDTVWR